MPTQPLLIASTFNLLVLWTGGTTCSTHIWEEWRVITKKIVEWYRAIQVMGLKLGNACRRMPKPKNKHSTFNIQVQVYIGIFVLFRLFLFIYLFMYCPPHHFFLPIWLSIIELHLLSHLYSRRVLFIKIAWYWLIGTIPMTSGAKHLGSLTWQTT